MRRTIAAALLLLAMVGNAASAGETIVPKRLAKAKVGEWILMQDVAGENAGEKNRYSVQSVSGTGDETVVTLKDERMSAAGELIETRTIELPLAKYNARMAELEDKAKQVSREKIVVKGDKEIVVYALTWDDEKNSREIKVWISDEIPVGGFVKSWSSDPAFPAAEIVDFGMQ